MRSTTLQASARTTYPFSQSWSLHVQVFMPMSSRRSGPFPAFDQSASPAWCEDEAFELTPSPRRRARSIPRGPRQTSEVPREEPG